MSKDEKNLAEFLKEKRQERKLSLNKLSELTKIQIYHLEALETGQFEKLPPSVYRAGMFERLAKFLDIDRNEIIEMYKQEVQAVEALPRFCDDNTAKSKKNPYFFLTPKKITIFFGILLLVFLGVYLGYQLKFLIGPPNLAVNPKEDMLVAQESVRIDGKTDPGIYLTINGENVYVDPDGNFSKEVQLAVGANIVNIRAVNNFGKAKEVIRQIFRQTQ